MFCLDQPPTLTESLKKSDGRETNIKEVYVGGKGGCEGLVSSKGALLASCSSSIYPSSNSFHLEYRSTSISFVSRLLFFAPLASWSSSSCIQQGGMCFSQSIKEVSRLVPSAFLSRSTPSGAKSSRRSSRRGVFNWRSWLAMAWNSVRLLFIVLWVLSHSAVSGLCHSAVVRSGQRRTLAGYEQCSVLSS